MKILIVDDHAVVREGVAALLGQLSPSVTFLQSSDIASAVSLAADHADIDIALIDLIMPGVSGCAALDYFTAAQPTVPVIVLSSSEDAGDVRAALARGALGYISKAASPASLLAAIRLVLAGEIYVPPFLAHETPSSLVNAELTARQRDVLAMIIAQSSNKEIAHRLAISEKTVKTHLTTIFRKLNVVNRAEAARAGRV